MTEKEAVWLEYTRWKWQYNFPEKPLSSFPLFNDIKDLQGMSPLCEYYDIYHKTTAQCKKCPIYKQFNADCFKKQNIYYDYDFDDTEELDKDEAYQRKQISFGMMVVCEKELLKSGNICLECGKEYL